MAPDSGQTIRLAAALRELRESHWADVRITQAELAKAFETAPATISSWESETRPKSPPRARLSAYARFFATRRSLEGAPHLLLDDELTEEELDELRAIEKHLLGLLRESEPEGHSTFTFDTGPITVICPEAPKSQRGELANESDPNYTQLRKYADLDALIEMFGHLRAMNPALDVFHRIPPDVRSDDISTHVVLLGGIAWNRVTRRFQDAIQQVPITQIADPKVTNGEIFSVDNEKKFYPVWDEPTEPSEKPELAQDVGFLARLPNPFNVSRTLTICNGVHSRGVYGAVRCLTDRRVQDANERYLAQRFPAGPFALLFRVNVVANETISPDLQNPETRLYEWPARKPGSR